MFGSAVALLTYKLAEHAVPWGASDDSTWMGTTLCVAPRVELSCIDLATNKLSQLFSAPWQICFLWSLEDDLSLAQQLQPVDRAAVGVKVSMESC